MEKEILRRLWYTYGEAVILEPRKLRAHLLDRGVPKKRINLLIDISTLPYFKQFFQEINDDIGARERLIYNVKSEYAFEWGAMNYGVDCWVYAFSKKESAAGELNSSDRNDTAEFCGKSIEPEGDLSDSDAKIVAKALREMMNN